MIGKTCIKCNKKKPRSEFHKDSAAGDGLRNECKGCKTAEARARYHADVERNRANARESMARSRENKKKEF